MSEGFRPERSVDQGKAAILKGVQDLMAANGIDIRPIYFAWNRGIIYKRWLLTIYHNDVHHLLKFEETDVIVWLQDQGVAAKYADDVLELIEKLKES
jgi:hypothetical protein